MKSATAWFAHYGESHQNGTNKLIHWICIPIILVNTLGLLRWPSTTACRGRSAWA